MSWWWSKEQQSTDVPGAADTPQRAPGATTQPEPALPSTAPPSHSQPSSSTPNTLSRDEQAYQELKDLFSQIDPERSTAAAALAKESVTKIPEDYSNSIYASTMSCSQCFDQAYYCSSIGGQMNSIYRYGALRSCSDLWAQWRFCMRTKTMSEETKRTKIREFNQKKAAKYKLGASSEDVWELRKEPVENPFSRSAES